jgi:MoaA/NifB/PqqE/SkfB family radical SAM enzyme
VHFTVDIELTNRCNAKCHFCPRDQTPHEGLMSRETFEQSLARAIEFRALAEEKMDSTIGISLCGLGEPMLNRLAPEAVRKVREAGFDVTMSSNGSTLTEAKSIELLDAGLQKILINVGEEGSEYEDVYKLSFAKTRDNVVRFAQLAEGRCEVYVVLVDHRRDAAHIERMKEYWRGHGITRFYTYEVMNRGGALFVDHMQFESYPQLAQARALVAETGTPLCGAPFGYLFVGYDGQYYLCCSDWKKETPMGSVFDHSFRSVMEQKLQHVLTREPVCKTCNLDPLNILTDELRAYDEGESTEAAVDATLASVIDGNTGVHDVLEKFGVSVTGSRPVRRSIPLRVVS